MNYGNVKGYTVLLVFLTVSVVILLFIALSLMVRVGRLEKKTADVSARDLAAFVEQMREILIESENTAERLDAAITERESALEDLSDLVESRIDRLRKVTVFESSRSIEDLPLGNGPLQNKIFRMLLKGDSVEDIAVKLKLTVDEVDMIIDAVKE